MTWELVTSLVLLIIAGIAFGRAAQAVGAQVWFESRAPYNVDTPLYWTVGRGILEGLVPYRDLFETKPPGIFLLSALSLWTTGGFKLTNAGHVLSMIVIAGSPLVFLRGLMREPRLLLARAGVWFALATVVLLLAHYSAKHSAEVQVETFGLGAAVVYLLLIGKPGRWAFAGRTVALMSAIGFKEPFLLTLPAGYLVLRQTPQRDVKDFWGPLALAGVSGTLFLALAGWLDAFLNVYLKSMVGGHVQVGGSPLDRAFAFEGVWLHLKEHSKFLPYAVLYSMFVYIASANTSDPNGPTAAKRLQTLFVGMLLVCLAVGMGGTYYGHHFSMALPFFLAILFFQMRDLASGGQRYWLRAGIVGLAALLPIGLPLENYARRIEEVRVADAQAQSSAKVIDTVLDRIGADRYLFLGPGGYVPLPYTRHLPLGPLFFQQLVFFEGKYPRWFADQLRMRLSEAKVVVLFTHNTGPMDAEIQATLERSFEALPAELAPKSFPYQILVRKDRAGNE